MRLQVSVQYLSIMDVLQRKTYLSKPVENVVLAPILQFPTCLVPYLILLLDFALEVTAVCKVHDNAQFAFFRFVDLLEPDNVGMLKHLKNFGLSQGFTTLFLVHLFYINLLNDGELFGLLTIDEVGCTE